MNGRASTVDELVTGHYRLAYALAQGFFLPGADRDDVRQEAMIGLLEAARCYDGTSQFASFAAVVIRRRLMDAVDKARRFKQQPLTTAAPLEYPAADGYLVERYELAQTHLDPAVIVETREHLAAIVDGIRALSPLEQRALIHVANGEPYTVGKVRDKQLDNAAQRARRKLRRAA